MIGIDAIGAAQTGISAALTQLNAAAHNVVNVQSVKAMDEAAFQGERPLLSENPSGGVDIAAGVPAGTREGIPVAQPDNPMADAAGYVRLPDLDIAAEMVNLLAAEHAVAANVTTVHRAVDAYRDLLAMTDRDRSRVTAATAL